MKETADKASDKAAELKKDAEKGAKDLQEGAKKVANDAADKAT